MSDTTICVTSKGRVWPNVSQRSQASWAAGFRKGQARHVDCWGTRLSYILELGAFSRSAESHVTSADKYPDTPNASGFTRWYPPPAGTAPLSYRDESTVASTKPFYSCFPMVCRESVFGIQRSVPVRPDSDPATMRLDGVEPSS